MKIALIAPTFLPARRANTVQVMKMAQALIELGHEVRATVPGTRPTGLAWPDLARHYGLHVREFPLAWLPARPRLRSYDYAFEALLQVRTWKADLVYTRLPQAAALASLAGWRTIFEVHDLPSGSGGPRLMRAFLRGKGAARLVAITQALEDDLAAIYGPFKPALGRCVAPDGVDLERYAGLPAPELARRELNLPFQGFTAGYTGHLYAGRGSGLLLEVAGRLPDMDFLLVGGEPQALSEMRARAGQLGLNNVFFTGFIPNRDLPLYQSACEVLLMPYEQRVAGSSGGNIAPYLSPMKLFEYMAAERVILSSDLPVLREVLNPENAVLLPPGDSEAWAAALRRLRSDAETRTRLAKRARLDVRRYTWKARAEKILAGI